MLVDATEGALNGVLQGKPRSFFERFKGIYDLQARPRHPRSTCSNARLALARQ